MLQRAVNVEKLEFVRRPKPCTAFLQVGDVVRLNGLKGPGCRVLDLRGDEVVVESLDWRGRSEATMLPRIILRKDRWLSFLHRLLGRFSNAM